MQNYRKNRMHNSIKISSIIFIVSTPTIGGQWSFGYGLGSDNGIAGFSVGYQINRVVFNVGVCAVYPMWSGGVGWVFFKHDRVSWESTLGSINTTDFYGGYAGLKRSMDFGKENGFLWQLGLDINYMRFYQSSDYYDDSPWMIIPYPAVTINYKF